MNLDPMGMLVAVSTLGTVQAQIHGAAEQAAAEARDARKTIGEMEKNARDIDTLAKNRIAQLETELETERRERLRIAAHNAQLEEFVADAAKLRERDEHANRTERAEWSKAMLFLTGQSSYSIASIVPVIEALREECRALKRAAETKPELAAETWRCVGCQTTVAKGKRCAVCKRDERGRRGRVVK